MFYLPIPFDTYFQYKIRNTLASFNVCTWWYDMFAHLSLGFTQTTMLFQFSKYFNFFKKRNWRSWFFKWLIPLVNICHKWLRCLRDWLDISHMICQSPTYSRLFIFKQTNSINQWPSHKTYKTLLKYCFWITESFKW